MRKIAFIIISVMLIALSGCSQKDIEKSYIYTGENENWTVEYKMTSTDSTAERSFTATYKGDVSQLSAAKTLEICFESTAASSRIVRSFTDKALPEKSYGLTSITEGGTIEGRDETINVTINIDGRVETLQLKSAK
jgi:uncharacterized lipoprotein YehR (DUF1307 family)